jgi:Protein of unknown function (DUF429)
MGLGLHDTGPPGPGSRQLRISQRPQPQAHGEGISRQAFALQAKILQVDAWVRQTQHRVVEVHREASFAQLAGAALLSPQVDLGRNRPATSTPRRVPQVIDDEEHERVHERVAAIDVAKDSGMVCTRTPHPSRPGARRSTVWTVKARMGAVRELGRQLRKDGIEIVTPRGRHAGYW